jgi:hypothetical protein
MEFYRCPTVDSYHARRLLETAREATTVTRMVTTMKPSENAIEGSGITDTSWPPLMNGGWLVCGGGLMS